MLIYTENKIDLINKQPIHENDTMEFKSPKELLKYMNSNIQYQPFRATWRLKTKDEVIKSGKGNCIDQVEFEVPILRKLNYKPKKMFVCEYKDNSPLTDNNIGGSHVFVYYTENDKFYWFEHAWGQYKGINGPYKDLDSMKESIKEKWNWNRGYSNLYFCSYGNLKEGSDLNQVYNSILGDKRPKVKPYYIKESTLITEVDVGGTPAGDDVGDGGGTADFTGEPASVIGNDTGAPADAPAADAGGDAPTDTGGDETEDFTAEDDTGGDDTGDNPDMGGDDTGGDETEDFTADDGGGGEGGDDAGDGDTGTDTSAGGSTLGDGSIKADDARGLENEIFNDLTPSQIAIKHKELKNNFSTMHQAINEIIDRVNEISSPDYQNAITFVSEQLSNLKEMLADYISNVYSTKSYMENAMNYNRFLATLNGINEILKEIDKSTNGDRDNKSSN